MLENLGVFFVWGIFGLSKSKSRNYNLIEMFLRNVEEILVIKERKFRICELEIIYNFKVFIY